MVPNCSSFLQCFRKILQFLKFEAANFKYENSYLKFYPINTQIRHIWSQIYALLFSFKVLQFDKFESADFKYENSYLKFYQKNIEITHSWSQIYAVSYFLQNFAVWQIWGRWFQIWQKLFSKIPSKIPK